MIYQKLHPAQVKRFRQVRAMNYRRQKQEENRLRRLRCAPVKLANADDNQRFASGLSKIEALRAKGIHVP